MPILDLSEIPHAEDDRYEFKSSQTTPNKLKEKIEKAASAFCNTGGGCFLAGVGNDGNADGGYPQHIGRQSIRDWVDQVLPRVEPRPFYTVSLIDNVDGRGVLKQDHVVLAIEFPESFHGPHMASDHIYYIRAGAHSVPARNFIVESIRAKRQVSTPQMRHLVKIDSPSLDLSATVCVSIDLIAITDSPLLDVKVNVVPEPPPQNGVFDLTFPLRIRLIDRLHDFVFHFEMPTIESDLSLHVEFSDLMGNRFTYQSDLNLRECIWTWHLGRDNPFTAVVDALRDVTRAIEKS